MTSIRKSGFLYHLLQACLSSYAASQKIKMLLYWGMFTVGFLFGSILAFVTFAPKKPEEGDVEYSQGEIRDYEGQLGPIEGKNNLPEMIFSKESEGFPKSNTAFAKKDPESYKISLTN